MKISVAIPAYNVEKYIESCLTSVVRQDLPSSDYEILVVNDGSTDSTLSKIVDFAKKYRNIVVLDKKNEGLSATRNLCIDKACGEYLLFLDSDDTIVENCLATIYSQMKEEKLDILEFDFICVDEKGDEIIPRIYRDGDYQRPPNVVMSGRDNLLYSDYFIPMVPMRAYRRDFLLEHHLYMIHKKHEDENFTPRAYYYAQRVKNSGLVLYQYLIRKNSIMGSYGIQNLFDMTVAMGLLKEFVREVISPNDLELHSFFNKRIDRIIRMTYLRSDIYGCKIQQELVNEMKKNNVYPFDIVKKKKYKIIFDLSTYLFVRYYNKKLRKKGLL